MLSARRPGGLAQVSSYAFTECMVLEICKNYEGFQPLNLANELWKLIPKTVEAYTVAPEASEVYHWALETH